MTGDPPSSAGADHDTVTADAVAEASTPVGASGAATAVSDQKWSAVAASVAVVVLVEPVAATTVPVRPAPDESTSVVPPASSNA